SSSRSTITSPDDSVTITANVQKNGAAASNAGVKFGITSDPTSGKVALSGAANNGTVTGITDSEGNTSVTLVFTNGSSFVGSVVVTASVGLGGSTGCPTSGHCTTSISSSSTSGP